jgi:biopolymer transport protein ExbB/TolQ
MGIWLDRVSPLLAWVEQGIFLLLLILGVATLGIFLWRYQVLRKAKGNPDKWMRFLSGDLDRNPDGGPGPKEQDAPARLVRTGLANLERVPEALERLLDAQSMAERRELEKGASFLATVGSNAPFIGLTGTVIGILTAFHHFSATGGSGGTQVMSAISRSLVATALGLLVAIPAVVAYNVLRVRIRSIQDRSRELTALLMARSLQAAGQKEP